MMYNNKFVAVISCNGSILREKEGGVVYLPFGSEYSILLKNKHCRKALVSVEIDGVDVLNGHQLIIQPNSTEELKGFMKDMNRTNRFKFIKKTKQIQDYRGDRLDDGLVRVSYRFEKHTEPIWVYCSTPNYWTDGPGYSYTTYYSNVCDSFTSCTTNCNFESRSLNKDEGITVKGARVNVDYWYGSIGNLEENEDVIILHLRGNTGSSKKVFKPITVKTKLTCSTCGKVSKSSARFCSRCGTYLE